MVACMMVANLLITPFYMHVTVSDVRGLIPTLLFPFNLTKGFLNASLVLLLYKPVTRALRASGLIRMQSTEPPVKTRKITIIIAIIAAVLVVISILVFLVLLNGQFELYRS